MSGLRVSPPRRSGVSLAEIAVRPAGVPDGNAAQRAVAAHVLWCRKERDRLTEELAQFEAGTKSIGMPDIGEPMTRGSLTQIAYLRRSIDQLGRVIGAYPEVPNVPGS